MGDALIRLRSMTSVCLTAEGRFLLLYRQGSRVANERWIASAGGHFEPGELDDPEACAFRELREELALSPKDLDGFALRYVTLRQVPGEIRQNYYYFAALRDPERPLSSPEGILRWFRPDEIPDLKMAHTAKAVYLHYIRTGSHSDVLYGGIAVPGGVEFVPLEVF